MGCGFGRLVVEVEMGEAKVDRVAEFKAAWAEATEEEQDEAVLWLWRSFDQATKERLIKEMGIRPPEAVVERLLQMKRDRTR
jgi:hypothetical protein